MTRVEDKRALNRRFGLLNVNVLMSIAIILSLCALSMSLLPCLGCGVIVCCACVLLVVVGAINNAGVYQGARLKVA